MARRKNDSPRVDLSAFDRAGARVVDNPLTTEVENSYLEYAYSVIHSRALPDARDGLKPVHRRILFSMHEQGHRPDRPYVKSSRVVGDVMGRYHPHGDDAIYDAMVRLAQDFSLNAPLIDGHGNFGSLDDGPAASRYTEARMSREAMLLVGEIGEGTVDFKANYDGSEQEPKVLPAAFPNLLVNGTSGIAVGMATNMIPHNLGEVVAAARHMITEPDADLDALMRFVPGPDLPTGGQLLGLDEVRRAYETGRGVVRMRARARTGPLEGGRGRQAITVVELPYGIGAEKIIEAITDEVKGKLKGSAMALSGGQQQRLCIARAIATEPDVILMDEPCSSLDPRATLQIEELMADLKTRYTIVIVTHNMQQAARASDRTAFMTMGDDRSGFLVEQGPTIEIFTNPKDRLTEDYVSGRFG